MPTNSSTTILYDGFCGPLPLGDNGGPKGSLNPFQPFRVDLAGDVKARGRLKSNRNSPLLPWDNEPLNKCDAGDDYGGEHVPYRPRVFRLGTRIGAACPGCCPDSSAADSA